MTYDSVLWVLSTELSHARAAAPVRQLTIQLRSGSEWAVLPL